MGEMWCQQLAPFSSEGLPMQRLNNALYNIYISLQVFKAFGMRSGTAVC